VFVKPAKPAIKKDKGAQPKSNQKKKITAISH